MLSVKNAHKEPEREIFNIDRSDRKEECKPPRKIRVRFFDMVIECLKGKGYVEMEISDEEDAFEDTTVETKTINIKDDDI